MTIQTRKIGSGPLYFKGLLYGMYGAGKTWLASTAALHPAMAPALLVNIEGGTVTASNVQDIDETDQLYSVADADEVFWLLANGRDGFDKYKTVIVDSGSALQQMNITEVARANAKANKQEIRVSQQDYGDSTVIVLDVLRRYRNLPKHIITLAGEREDFDTEKAVDRLRRGPIKVAPDFTPALQRRLNHVFDHVWCLKIGDDGATRYLLTQPQAPYHAKTRGKEFAEALGPVVENPNMPDIFNLFIKTHGQSAPADAKPDKKAK